MKTAEAFEFLKRVKGDGTGNYGARVRDGRIESMSVETESIPLGQFDGKKTYKFLDFIEHDNTPDLSWINLYVHPSIILRHIEKSSK